MSRLTNNSTPAERERGCTFAETFESSAKVVENGGGFTGSPPINFGMTVSAGNYGYNDCYIPVSAELTFIFEFIPDFSNTDGSIHGMWATDGSEYYLRKHSDGSLRLGANVGDKLTATEESVTANWKINERNVCVGFVSDGDCKIYLNGVLLVSNSASITPKVINRINHCTNEAGANPTTGVLNSFKVFVGELTAQEVADHYNNSTYSYCNEAVLDLPMGLAQHDPANNRTLDVSGNGLHGTLGAGDGGATTPTKSDHRGYDFDGSDDYITCGNNALLRPTTAMTVSVWSKSRDTANDEIVSYRENAGSGIFALYDVSTAGCAIKTNNDVSETSSLDATQQLHTWTHTVLTFSQDDQEVRSYVNGDLQADIEGTGDLPLATELAGLDQLFIGSAREATRNIDGEVAMVKMWDSRLTELQVKDLFEREKKQLNDN